MQTRQLGDYANVDAAEAGNLVDRLDEMHALDSFRAYKREVFDFLRLEQGYAVADVGCGTGDDARQLAEQVGPAGRVVGYDLSEAMVAEAAQRHSGVEGLSFQAARSDELGVPSSTFDAVRADRVLIHVPEPRATLREMMRVAKSGASIVISEPDMPGCWVASDNDEIAARVMQAISNSCVTPFFARELWAAFKDAELEHVRLMVSPVTAFDPIVVDKILSITGAVEGMIAQGVLEPRDATNWLSGLIDRGRKGRFVAGLNIITAAGVKR